MGQRKVAFTSQTGDELSGVVHEPDGDIRAYCLFAHCFTCGKSLSAVRYIGNELAKEGIGLMRFDFTGLGQSEGDFASTSFTTNLQDLIAASKYMADELEAPKILVGHSLGGAAVLAVADQLESVRGVATIGAPSEPQHVRHLVDDAEFGEDDTAQVSIGGRNFRVGRQFVEDLETHDMEAEIGELRVPIVIFHSPVDKIVGIHHAERIFKAARHPKSFVSLGEADHLVSDESTARFLGHMLSAWSEFALTHK